MKAADGALPSRRLLYADDDPEDVMLLTRGMGKWGWKVQEGQGAIETMILALNDPPDAIVVDSRLPAGTGYVILRRLKRSEKTRSIPVLVLTEAGDKHAARRARRMGAHDAVPRPVEPAELHRRLCRALEDPTSEASEAGAS